MTYVMRYPQIAAALTAALADDPYYIRLRQIAGESDAALAWYMDYSMVEAETYGRLHLTPDGTHGAAVWSVPLDPARAAEKKTAKHAFLHNHLGDAGLAYYATTGDAMAGLTGTVVPAGSWYLSILGVAPEQQGRGLGRTLLAPVLAQTDALGIATYLETFTPENIPFYARLGYAAAGTFHEPTVGAEYTVMVRLAGG